jgi:hypothetical protein
VEVLCRFSTCAGSGSDAETRVIAIARTRRTKMKTTAERAGNRMDILRAYRCWTRQLLVVNSDSVDACKTNLGSARNVN